MQKVNQKLDQKNQIINKITLNRRKRPREYFNRGQQQMELPIIENTLYTSKAPPPKRNEKFIGNLASRKLENELDEIINGALKSFKNQKINKVIFANPLTQRICLGKTYYKASRYSTVDTEINSFYSLQKRKNFIENKERLMNISFTPIKINKQTDFMGRIDFYLGSKSQQKKQQKSPQAYLTAVEQIKQKPKLTRRANLKEKSQHILKKGLDGRQKYSPWNNQGDDEAIEPSQIMKL